MADRNFKAIHLKQKDNDLDVWLISGEGFMTNEPRYQMHLEKAQESRSVSTISIYFLINFSYIPGTYMPLP